MTSTTNGVKSMDIEKLEDRAYDSQYEYIKKNYGKQRADRANYGWSVYEAEDEIVISTKVYGRDLRILITVVDIRTGSIAHEVGVLK
jgi:hypothetical protein